MARSSQRLYRPLLLMVLNHPAWILLGAGAALVAVLVILPGLGRVFLPEFQERSLVLSLDLFPGSSLAATDRTGFAIQTALKQDPRFETIQMRSGRSPGDPHIVGSNFAELDLELSTAGMENREETLAALRQELDRVPGVAVNVGGVYFSPDG